MAFVASVESVAVVAAVAGVASVAVVAPVACVGSVAGVEIVTLVSRAVGAYSTVPFSNPRLFHEEPVLIITASRRIRTHQTSAKTTPKTGNSKHEQTKTCSPKTQNKRAASAAPVKNQKLGRNQETHFFL